MRSRPISARAWWLAAAAVAVCGPWPGWQPPAAALVAVVAGLAVLARPRGWQLVAWSAAVLACAVALVRPPDAVDRDHLAAGLDRHCRGVLELARQTVADGELRRVLAAPGEAIQPERPFDVLDRHLAGIEGRTLYLADDRGRVVAWAGERRPFPQEVRPLGPREWSVEWSATSATLVLREPVLLEGRLAGAVTVADRAPLYGKEIWSMRTPRGWRLLLGGRHRGADEVRAASLSGVSVAVEAVPAAAGRSSPVAWLPWLLLILATLVEAPAVALASVAVAGLAVVASGPPGVGIATALVVLGVGASVGRWGRQLTPVAAGAVVAAALAAGVVSSSLAVTGAPGSWLPAHLLRPGWGGVWSVAAAWALLGLPRSGSPLRLGRRLVLAGVIAVLALTVEVVRAPVELLRSADPDPGGAVLPREPVELAQLLPAPPQLCRLDDLAPRLATEWDLGSWRAPVALVVTSQDGLVVSRWGDLGPAEPGARVVREWPIRLPEAGTVALETAAEPWGWLRDWDSGRPLHESGSDGPRFAVLTRSGTVAATLHPEVRGLSPEVAGALFHDGRGWAWVRVEDGRRLARVWRRGDWLVAAIDSSPAVADWIVQAMLAALWALGGMLVGQPPLLRQTQVTTFGGRLRLLIAGGVVIPLAALTLLLNLRLTREEGRLEQAIGQDALRAARWTTVHLAAVDAIDDDLARWLSVGAGAEVTLFDGAEPVATSRPDLMAVGRLPGLPVASAFTQALLGRDEPVVVRQAGRLVAAGPVIVQDRHLLLQIEPPEPVRSGDLPGAVDWLLAGAIFSALLALVSTSRVEQRLSASLDDLVAVARRLHAGEPVGEIRRPEETDLAAVVDAVRTMSREVERRELGLRHQEELLRITLATLDPAVVVLAADESVRFANPSAEHLLADDREVLLATIRRLARARTESGGPVVDTVQPYPGRDLTWRVGVAGVPLPDGGRGLVAAVDDVSEVVRADRLRQLTQLARIVAHEVKNPLTPIRLWVQELAEGRTRLGDDERDELLAEACREISHQVERLQEMANSFSNLVALEHWEAGRVDLAELVPEALTGFGVLARRGVAVTTELPAPGSAIVTGDRQWLRRALDNLIRNSLDALKGEPGEIRLRVLVRPGAVALEIADSGGGVPESLLGELFSPHFSTTSGGSGLGLALVHHVATRCQGRVEASNGDDGLVVRLVLPAADSPSGTMSP